MPPNNLFNYGQQSQPLQMQQNNNVLAVPVNGESGAQNYLVAAGNTVLLTDFNSGFIWLKSTDPNGMFQNLRKFKVEEITPKPMPANNDFVLRSEFEKLQQSIDTLLARIGGNDNESISTTAAKSSNAVQAGK